MRLRERKIEEVVNDLGFMPEHVVDNSSLISTMEVM